MNATSEGAGRLTEFAAAAGGDQQELLGRLAGRSPDDRWGVLADAVMRNRLAGVVPADLQHQQAVRAELTNAMAHEGWNRADSHQAEAATDSIQGTEAATTRIRDHYAIHTHPYPAAEPSQTPPALPLATDADPALRAALSGQPRPRATQPNLTGNLTASHPKPGSSHSPVQRRGAAPGGRSTE